MRLWRWPYARCVLEFSDFSLNNVLLSSQLLHISSYFIHFTQNLVLSTSKHTRQYSLHASETLIIIPWISLTAILTFAYEILPLHHSTGVAVTNSTLIVIYLVFEPIFFLVQTVIGCMPYSNVVLINDIGNIDISNTYIIFIAVSGVI